MLLELDPQACEVLADVLRRAMGDLREEIYKTDATDYEEQLRRREAILGGLIDRLAAVSA